MKESDGGAIKEGPLKKTRIAQDERETEHAGSWGLTRVGRNRPAGRNCMQRSNREKETDLQRSKSGRNKKVGKKLLFSPARWKRKKLKKRMKKNPRKETWGDGEYGGERRLPAGALSIYRLLFFRPTNEKTIYQFADRFMIFRTVRASKRTGSQKNLWSLWYFRFANNSHISSESRSSSCVFSLVCRYLPFSSTKHGVGISKILSRPPMDMFLKNLYFSQWRKELHERNKSKTKRMEHRVIKSRYDLTSS